MFLTNFFQTHFQCPKATGCGKGYIPKNGWKVVGELNGKFGELNGIPGYGPEFGPKLGPVTVRYHDPAWPEFVLAWVKKVSDKSHSLGLNLVVNVSYVGSANPADRYAFIPADNPELLRLFDLVDGVFDEGGFTSGYPQGQIDGCSQMWSYNGDYYQCKGRIPNHQDRWTNFSDYIQAVQKRGKAYFSKNTTQGPLINVDDPQPEEAAINWSLASFLMSRGTSPSHARQAIYMTENRPGVGDALGRVPYDSPLYWRLNPAIGFPCEIRRNPERNVFTREFSRGFVVVNANRLSGASTVIKLPKRLPSYALSWPASAPKVLAAKNGAVILVKTGHLCGHYRY